jgi:pimeloyl-ACP methyl ester carboxylesterase
VFQSDDDGHVVVSFRGTNSFDNWKKRNLDFRKVDDGRGNMVHAGFKSGWDLLKPRVDQDLYDIFGQNAFTNNVTFTGHSLGGAIAQLATSDYSATQDSRLIDGVTFASPVVGDEGFNNSVPGGHLMNVVDPRDSVPKIVQELQPDFKVNTLARRWMSLGDRAARVNDKVKKDAIRFGIELSFDVGIGLLLAYAPEMFEGAEVAEVAVPEAGEALFEGALALEEEAVLAAEKAAGLGAVAEEATAIEVIGGGSFEGVTTAERANISLLMNAESRASIVSQLRAIDVSQLAENAVRDAAGKINWEVTMTKVMAGAGISEGVQNLVVPFIMENVEGMGEVDPEQIQFLMQNGWDYMYGAVVAHPVDTYIKNVDTRFGDKEANARDMMWQNFQANSKAEGRDPSDVLQFMTEDELKQFQEDFAHGIVDDVADGADDDNGAGDFDDDEVDEDDDGEVDVGDDNGEDDGIGVEGREGGVASLTHNLAGREMSEVSGRPLQVINNHQARKANGERIFGVIDEDGETLTYTGPSHPSSTTTLFGKWTGVAPFANAEPMKVNRHNAFGGQAYSALDTFSLAYLVNSYMSGYHNSDADAMYQRRINAAIDNGFISDAVDPEELRVARKILTQFEEKGHLFGVEVGGMTTQGNILSEINTLSRGALSDVGDDVNGVAVGFSSGTKRKIEKALSSREGTMVARDIMTRSAKRLKSSEVDDSNIMEESTRSIDFNLKALAALGLDKSPEFGILLNGAKQNALAYKTALNVESRLAEVIDNAQLTKGASLFDSTSPNSILPNVTGQYTSRVPNTKDDSNLSGHEEYVKDMVVMEILKSVV